MPIRILAFSVACRCIGWNLLHRLVMASAPGCPIIKLYNKPSRRCLTHLHRICDEHPGLSRSAICPWMAAALAIKSPLFNKVNKVDRTSFTDQRPDFFNSSTHKLTFHLICLLHFLMAFFTTHGRSPNISEICAPSNPRKAIE
eukprot:Gb_25429 [translate_table: standard]